MGAEQAPVPGEVCVLVAGPQANADASYQALEAWARAGLLKDVLLVGRADLDRLRPRAGDDIEATLLSGAPRRVLLFQEIARASAPAVRLVCLQLVAGEQDVDKGLCEAAGVLESELELRLAHTQRKFTLNVVVPASATTGLPPEILLPLWDVNVVIASEDRRTDRQADQGVRRDHNYAAHAALGCATAAGLWRHMPAGPFDGRTLPSGDRFNVLVARCSARVLFGHGLTHGLMQQAFWARAAAAPQVARAAGGREADRPERIAEETAAVFAERAAGGVLEYRPPEPELRRRPPPLSLRGTFAAVAAFWASRLRELPFERPVPWDERVDSDMRHWVRGGAAAAVAGTGAVEGVARPAPGPDEATAAREFAEAVLEGMRSAGMPSPEPGLWQELRAACFGLVDGGELPSYLANPMEGPDRAIILEIKHVVPAPDRSPFRLANLLPPPHAEQPVSLEPLRLCDPYQAGRVRSWLTHLAEDESDQTSSHAASSACRQLDIWVSAAGGALVWRVAEHLASRLDRAREDLKDSLGRIAAGEPGELSEQAVKAEVRRLRFHWAVECLAGALGLAAGGALLVLGAGLGPALLAAGTGVLLWLGSALGSFVGCRFRLARLAHEYDRRIGAYARALRAARASALEMTRLAALYQQLRDWAELLAWMLHRPEGRSEDVRQQPQHPGPLPHPLALRFGSGCHSADSLERLRLEAIELAFAKGWLSALYATYLERAVPELARERLGDESLAVALDMDVHGQVRGELRRLLHQNVLPAAWRAALGARLAGTLRCQPVAELFPTVRLLDVPGTLVEPGSANREPECPAPAFLMEILPAEGAGDHCAVIALSLWTTDAILERAPFVREITVWGPAGALPPPEVTAQGGGPAMRAHWLPPADGTADDRYLLQVTRLDVAGEIAINRLAIFDER